MNLSITDGDKSYLDQMDVAADSSLRDYLLPGASGAQQYADPR